MEKKIPAEYISNIAKASAYFTFRNGPIKKMNQDGKISDEELREIQEHMQNHLAYLYTVLLEENNIKKFDLIVQTMNKFYVNDDINILIDDDGFDKFYDGLFPKVNNITIQK